MRSRGRPTGRVRAVQFDPSSRIVRRDGVELPRLSPQEGILLEMLAVNAPSTVTLESIERRLWPGRPPMSAHQRIRDVIGRLREVLGDSVENPCWIENVSGAGYAFAGTSEKPEPAPQPEAQAGQSPLSTTALPSDPIPEQQITSHHEDGSDSSEAPSSPLTKKGIVIPLSVKNLDQPEGGWQRHWPGLLTLAIFTMFGWATWEGAYGLAVFLICFGTGAALLSYLRMADTVYTRAFLASIILLAMAYIPSASTLTEIMTTVVNAGTLQPALVYPFVTGLKFIPLFCVLLGYWTLLSLFAEQGFRRHPNLGKAYLLLGPVCLGTTLVLLASASGDGQIWKSQVPGCGILLLGYTLIFGVNVAVWITGYQFLRAEFLPHSRPFLTLCGIAYVPVALLGAAVDHQYNVINRFGLDQRRPEAYVVQNPAALEHWRQLAEGGYVGPDLERLLDDPQFRKALLHERFYKQNFERV